MTKKEQVKVWQICYFFSRYDNLWYGLVQVAPGMFGKCLSNVYWQNSILTCEIYYDM